MILNETAVRQVAVPEPRPLVPTGRPTGLGGWGPYDLLEQLASSSGRTTFRARRFDGTAISRIVFDSRPPRVGSLDSILNMPVQGLARMRAGGRLPDGTFFFESELPKGESLFLSIVRHGKMPAARVFEVFDSILETLGATHERNAIHGSLCSGGTLLLEGQRPILYDLGLGAIGTPDELRATAPEVWRGQRPTPQSDLYSVGILLYFALTGRFPFDATEGVELCRRHLHVAPPSLAAGGFVASKEAELLVANLLAKDPTFRHPNADAARAALQLAWGKAIDSSAGEAARARHPAPTGYRFLRHLGSGACGDVFESLHEALGTVIAIKVSDPHGLDGSGRVRFLREARLAASIDHPGIVKVLDAREEHGRLYLMMELVSGESLAQKIEREGPLDDATATALLRQVLDAVGAAHRKGIIHRDLKPENILIDRRGRARISDFGLARSLLSTTNITHGQALGTPLYMSPEQCMGKAVDARSDLYSIGAAFFAVMGGRPPFQGPSAVHVLRAHVDEAPPRLERVAPKVRGSTARLIGRLLSKNPDERYANAAQVVRALSTISTTELKRSQPPTGRVDS